MSSLPPEKSLFASLVHAFPQADELRAWVLRHLGAEIGGNLYLPGDHVSPADLADETIQLLARHRGDLAPLALALEASGDAVYGLLRSGIAELPADLALRTPSALLQAQYRVVPFVGRERLLEGLVTWCREPARDGLSVRLLIGPGGSGKTRLLLETCLQVRQIELSHNGRPTTWAAGFLQRLDNLDVEWVVQRLRTYDRPRLVIIDYAENRTELVLRLLTAATQRGVVGPLRIVLLARSLGDWWTELLSEDRDVATLLERQPVTSLGLAFPTRAERSRWIGAGLTAFAGALGRQVPPRPVLPEDSDELGLPLYLWMTALLAVEGYELAGGEDLLDRVLAHEVRFWSRFLQERGHAMRVGPVRRSVGPVLAGATLAGGLADRHTVERMIARTRSPAEASDPALDDCIIALLRTFYGGPREDDGVEWVQGLQPDLLGEHLVDTMLRSGGGGVGGLIDLVSSGEFGGPRTPLTVLARLARRAPQATRWLDQAIARRPRALIGDTIQVGREVGGPIGDALARWFESAPDADLAASWALQVDHPSSSLGQLGEVLCRQALEAEQDVTERVRHLTRLGLWLRSHGEPAACLAVIQDHAGAVISMAARSPRMLFELQDVECAALAEAGDPDRAISRRLRLLHHRRAAYATDPANQLEGLAFSVVELARVVGSVGDWPLAIRLSDEGVEHFRLLAELEPDTFAPGLATALYWAADHLGRSGDLAGACSALREGAAVAASVAGDRPDVARPNLGRILDLLALSLAARGLSDEAADVRAHAVEVWWHVARDRPGAYGPELARARQRQQGATDASAWPAQPAPALFGFPRRPPRRETLEALAGRLLNASGQLRVAAARAGDLRGAEDLVRIADAVGHADAWDLESWRGIYAQLVHAYDGERWEDALALARRLDAMTTSIAADPIWWTKRVEALQLLARTQRSSGAADVALRTATQANELLEARLAEGSVRSSAVLALRVGHEIAQCLRELGQLDRALGRYRSLETAIDALLEEAPLTEVHPLREVWSAHSDLLWTLGRAGEALAVERRMLDDLRRRVNGQGASSDRAHLVDALSSHLKRRAEAGLSEGGGALEAELVAEARVQVEQAPGWVDASFAERILASTMLLQREELRAKAAGITGAAWALVAEQDPEADLPRIASIVRVLKVQFARWPEIGRRLADLSETLTKRAARVPPSEVPVPSADDEITTMHAVLGVGMHLYARGDHDKANFALARVLSRLDDLIARDAELWRPHRASILQVWTDRVAPLASQAEATRLHLQVLAAWRAVAEEQPAFSAHLAARLSMVSLDHRRAGQLETARALLEECVMWARRAVTVDDIEMLEAWQAQLMLAANLRSRAADLADLGRDQAALQHLDEAIRHLCANRVRLPDDVDLELAYCFTQQGRVNQAVDAHAEAIAAWDRAARILNRLIDAGGTDLIPLRAEVLRGRDWSTYHSAGPAAALRSARATLATLEADVCREVEGLDDDLRAARKLVHALEAAVQAAENRTPS